MTTTRDTEAATLQASVELQNRILHVFLASPDDEMYAGVLDLVLEALHSEHGLFGYIHEGGALICPSMTRSIWSACQMESKSLSFPRATWGGLWGRALTERRPLLANEGLVTPAGHIPLANALDVPVIFHGEVIGNLLVGNSPTPYTPEDQDLLQSIADLVAPVLSARLERDRSRHEGMRVRAALERRTHELDERVKELGCLYGITGLVERGLPWEDVVRGTVALIPPAWQFPEVAVARAVVFDERWESPGFAETPWRLASEIRVDGQPVGVVEICYTEPRSVAAEDPFFPEERILLDAIAERLGATIERQRAAAERDAQGRKIHLMESLRATVAVILAGGRGQRLHPLTAEVAKPAVPFGGKFRLIDFPLSNCLNSGVRRVAVVTQYKAHQLIRHVQGGWGFLRAERKEFVELWPAQQQTEAHAWYQGTADAVFQNLSILEHHAPAHVLILAGDHIYKQDYSLMLAEHLERSADVSVCCTEVPIEAASAFGVVGVDADDAIVSFREKPRVPRPIPDRPSHAFVSTGIYVFRAGFLFDVLRRDAADPESSHDFGRDVLPSLIGSCRIYAHRFSRSCVDRDGRTYWRDVGHLDAYWEANIDLTRLLPELDIYDESWPIWTYTVQQPPAKFVYDDAHRQGRAVNSLVSAGCIVSGALVSRSLLFRGVRVHSHALVEDAVVLPNADIGERAVVRRAVIDWGVRIPPGLIVGEDPAEDARRFFRTERGVVLVTQAMIDRLG